MARSAHRASIWGWRSEEVKDLVIYTRHFSDPASRCLPDPETCSLVPYSTQFNLPCHQRCSIQPSSSCYMALASFDELQSALDNRQYERIATVLDTIELEVCLCRTQQPTDVSSSFCKSFVVICSPATPLCSMSGLIVYTFLATSTTKTCKSFGSQCQAQRPSVLFQTS